MTGSNSLPCLSYGDENEPQYVVYLLTSRTLVCIMNSGSQPQSRSDIATHCSSTAAAL